MPKKYPLEFKKQAIRRYEKGESIPALCQELHVSQSTFYHWRNQYRSIQTSAHTYTPAEFDALVRRLQKAEHKLSIIQLSGYMSKVPLQDKLATLEHFHNEMSDLYSVHELCEALDVSRGTFYNHIFRRADRSKYESEKAQLMLKVKQIFDDSEQRYGADKIRAVLAENGLRISAKRVLSIMQELGFTSLKKDADGQELREIDWAHTKAIAQRGNHIYLNLKGRDTHGIVEPADQYEVEEDIMTALYGYKDKVTGKRVIAMALRNKDAVLLGMGGPESGDIVYWMAEGYNYDHCDSLSTTLGYGGTSVSPIFIAAGAGLAIGLAKIAWYLIWKDRKYTRQ